MQKLIASSLCSGFALRLFRAVIKIFRILKSSLLHRDFNVTDTGLGILVFNFESSYKLSLISLYLSLNFEILLLLVQKL